MSVFDYLDQEPGAETPQPRMSDLWEWARDDYFAGESADVVCARHKLSRSQFFERARREGWLRRDQPRKSAEPVFNAEEEEAFVEEALLKPPPTAYALYRRAWARAERAILMGRRVEAAGWTRLAKELRKLACEEADGARWKHVVRDSEPKPDCADSRVTNASPIPVSPAQAGAQVEAGADEDDRPPPPETARTWAPACAGETEVEEPDSPDSLPSSSAHPSGSGDPGFQLSEPPLSQSSTGRAAAVSLGPRLRGDERESEGVGAAGSGKPDSPDSLSKPPAPLNRQERRRLAKLRGRRFAQPAAAFAAS